MKKKEIKKLSKDEALYLLNKLEEKKIKKRQIQYFHS